MTHSKNLTKTLTKIDKIDKIDKISQELRSNSFPPGLYRITSYTNYSPVPGIAKQFLYMPKQRLFFEKLDGFSTYKMILMRVPKFYYKGYEGHEKSFKLNNYRVLNKKLFSHVFTEYWI